MFGALAHGLPQLVLPQGADQFANGAAVRRAGLGLTLEGDAVTAPAIADATQRLLTELRLASPPAPSERRSRRCPALTTWSRP